MYGEYSRYNMAPSRDDLVQARKHKDELLSKLKPLPLGGRRVLLAVLDVLNETNGTPITREDIRIRLKRATKLNPNDLIMLQRLVTMGVVAEAAVAINQRRVWQYTMDEDTAYLLNRMRK